MWKMFLDVTEEQLKRNTSLQAGVCLSNTATETTNQYIRVCIQDVSMHVLKQTLAHIIIEECIYWILRTDGYKLSREQKRELYKTVQEHLEQMTPQLELIIYHDIESITKWNETEHLFLNIDGYLRFSAKKLKWFIQTIIQEIYQMYQDNQERAEFIALLQFCVEVQPPFLEDVYLTLQADQFTLVDIWGNDLQKIYLEVLPEEECYNAQMHDLILSILMTMLPKKIHLFIQPEQIEVEQNDTQQKLIHLLQQIFTDRILIETEKKS